MCEPWQPTESEMQAIIKDLEKRLQISSVANEKT